MLKSSSDCDSTVSAAPSSHAAGSRRASLSRPGSPTGETRQPGTKLPAVRDTRFDASSRPRLALDVDARRQLFRFCRDHDSQVDRVRFDTPADAVAGDGLDPHLYPDDPGAADATVSTGGMGRLVDVAADLPAVAGRDVDGTASDVDLVVDDPVADWNDGRFRVTVTDAGKLDGPGREPTTISTTTDGSTSPGSRRTTATPWIPDSEP